jgi:hypothetical protein
MVEMLSRVLEVSDGKQALLTSTAEEWGRNLKD